MFVCLQSASYSFNTLERLLHRPLQVISHFSNLCKFYATIDSSCSIDTLCQLFCVELTQRKRRQFVCLRYR